MALEVGSVFTRLGYKVDDSGADRYERRLDGLRRDARKGVEADLRADVDSRGFDRYNRELDKAERNAGKAERSSGRLGKALGGVGRVAAVGAGAAFAGLGLGIGKATAEFEEAAKVAAQTDAVLKSTGGAANVTAKDVDALATALSNKTGIDDEAIASGQNLLLTFTNVRNEAGKGNDVFNQATKIATDMSVALGQDLKSSNIQLGKALNDPIKGITALSRVGVSFTAQQKEQIKTLTESGDRLGAQKLILAELQTQFAGSAEAQARPLDKAKVAVNNLFEAVGKSLAPAVTRVTNGFAKFVGQLQSGEGAGGRVRRAFELVAGAVRGVASFVGRAFTTIRSAFSGGDESASRLASGLRRTFSAAVATVRSFVNSFVRNFRGIRDELATIGRAIARFAELALAIFRRMLPGIRAIWEGVARIIRGVVQVISGILSGDFGKIAEGFKRILSGLVKAAGGILRALTAPFREVMARIGRVVSDGVGDVVGFFTRLPGKIVGALSRLPGTLADLGRRAVSGFARALSGLPGAIGGAIKGGGQFLGDIGRGIADWLNAHTPLGDKVKVGPISVRLPALRQGGNVGPGAGGPRAFIAGEGALPEWVISQEGDRRANIGWARDALETLTGRRVELHRGGKGAPRPLLSPGKRSAIGRGLGTAEGGIKNFERDIARLERSYGQKDREYGLTEEEFVTETDDGATLNTGQIDQRLGELGSLSALRSRIRDKYLEYGRAVQAVIGVYSKAKGRLSRALKRAKGSKRAKERSSYRDSIAKYQGRINELSDLAKDLNLDVGDQDLDLRELAGEADELSPENRGKLLPPAAAPATPEAPADTGAGVDTGSGSPPPADTGTDLGPAAPAAPTAEDIAAAAVAQVSAFNAARADLFGSFGGNFAAAGAGNPLAGELGGAAGMRYFGAGLGPAGAGGAGAPQVTQIITFPTPPEDPHGWTAASLAEMRAAL